MVTLLCAMMIVVGCGVILFTEKTIGFLSLNNMYGLNALVCTKILKSATVIKGKYYDYISNSHIGPGNNRRRGLFVQSPCCHTHNMSARNKSLENAGTWVISSLFRASWIKNCLLGCRSRAKLIHDIGRLAPRLSGDIQLTTLITR